jgi:hypothetical protein
MEALHVSVDPVAAAGSAPLLSVSSAQRLARTLADALADRSAPTVALYEAVSRYAAELRGHGLPPERMLVLVKELVRGTAPDSVASRAVQLDTDLLRLVVSWSIDAYYRAA